MALVRISTRASDGSPSYSYIESSAIREVYIDPVTQRTVIRLSDGVRYETEEKTIDFAERTNSHAAARWRTDA